MSDAETKSTRLVWSDDPKDKERVESKKVPKVQTQGPQPLDSSYTAVFRLEKAGRGGKTVTVLDQLPHHETYVKALLKELKNKCGTGGTFVLKSDCAHIELQGDKREAVKAILQKKGIRFKGM